MITLRELESDLDSVIDKALPRLTNCEFPLQPLAAMVRDFIMNECNTEQQLAEVLLSALHLGHKPDTEEDLNAFDMIRVNLFENLSKFAETAMSEKLSEYATLKADLTKAGFDVIQVRPGKFLCNNAHHSIFDSEYAAWAYLETIDIS